MVKVEKYSRKKKKEVLVYRQIVLTFIFGFLLLGLILLFGTQGLVNLASFLGNLKQSSTPIENLDRDQSSLPPRLAALPIATNSAQISVTGFAQTGTMIEVFLNDILADSTLTTKEGRFEAANLTLNEGENKIYAFTKIDDKRSPASRTVYVTFKKVPPELEITSPLEGAIISDEEKKVTVEGKTDPGASLRINERWVIVKKDGSFSFELSLSEGENKITIVTQDVAGNETEETLSVEYRP